MIIKEIYIDGFGIFHQYKLTNLAHGINIVEGENETGKSTLLNFIRYTLFGYPNKVIDRHEPISGSAGHGGRIVAQLSDGKEAIFERHSGGKGGRIQLHYDGNVLNDSSQWHLLLGNANIQLFQSVYGFTLNELINFDNLENSGIEDKIFSLGIGITNVSLGEVESTLISNAERIYKKGGIKQEIPQLLKSIEEKKLQIVTIQNGLQQYETFVTQIANLQSEIEELIQKIKGETAAKELQANYLKCYDSYTLILQIERDLKLLPSEFVCPEDAEQQLNSLDFKAESLTDAIEQLQSNDSDDGIEQIQKNIDSIQINDVILSQAEIITRLNEQLGTYQTSIGENLKTQKEIDDLNAEIRENLRKIDKEWSENDAKSFSNLVAHKDTIQQFNSQLEDLKQHRLSIIGRELAKKEQTNARNKNSIYYLAILISLLLSIPAFFYSVPFGIAFIGIALLIFLFFITSKKVTNEGNNNELEIIERKIDQLTSNYNEYLQMQLKLQPNLSFSAVLEIFNLVDTTNRYILRREEYQNSYKERGEYIKHFENIADELRKRELFQSDIDSYEIFVRDAKRELSTAKQNFESQERLKKILETKIREQSRLQRQFSEVQEKVNQLFRDAGEIDRNNFLQKYRSETEARRLLLEKKTQINTIEKIIGFGKTEELFSFLNGKERFDLESQLQQLSETIKDENSLLLQLTAEKGRLETEQKNLASNSTLAELETELEVERNKLFECYKQWLKSRLAFKVLNEIKKKYELEKQPDVIRYSSEVFSDITSGKYKRIHVPIDSKEVLIYDHQKRAKRIEQLSRGTKEQLLISLRLGLIQEYEKNKEPLPIVLDDVFVNFDSCRTKNIADALQKFTENRQVIIFTCHSNLAQNFYGPVNKISLPPFVLNEDQVPKELLLSQGMQAN